MLLGLAASAAVIVPAAPAQAERWSNPGFVAAANVTVHRGSSPSGHRWRDGRRDRDHDGRRHRDRDRFPRDPHRDRFDGALVIDSYGYYEDNPAWQSDGYNDWWHERRSRNTPRWVHNNQNCERQYSTGAGWKC
jgi:hypothetical protein